MLLLNAREERLDARRVGAVGRHGDPATTPGGDFVGGVVDRAVGAVEGPRTAPGGPAGDIDSGARGAECPGNSPPGAPAAAGDDGDMTASVSAWRILSVCRLY